MSDDEDEDVYALKPDQKIPPFNKAAHMKFFSLQLDRIPPQYGSMDTSRMTLLYFVLSALDVLGVIDALVKPEQKKEIVEWIYAQQIHPGDDYAESVKRCGFRPGPYLGAQDPHSNPNRPNTSMHQYDEAHITMTYTALASLLILNDDLSRVNRTAILDALPHLQQPDGRFSCTYSGTEADMRFLYCACAISAILSDSAITNRVAPTSTAATPSTDAAADSKAPAATASPALTTETKDDVPTVLKELTASAAAIKFPFDVDRAVSYVRSCQAYDGGLGLVPGAEGHGGSTYTGVASLALMGRLDSIPDKQGLIRWCILRQGVGYSGRPNKPLDTCYSFWIGATLKLLGAFDFTLPEPNANYNLVCQFKYGGFSKVPNSYADLLHAYMGLSGLSLMGKYDLSTIDVDLGLTTRATNNRLKRLSKE